MVIRIAFDYAGNNSWRAVLREFVFGEVILDPNTQKYRFTPDNGPSEEVSAITADNLPELRKILSAQITEA